LLVVKDQYFFVYTCEFVCWTNMCLVYVQFLQFFSPFNECKSNYDNNKKKLKSEFNNKVTLNIKKQTKKKYYNLSNIYDELKKNTYYKTDPYFIEDFSFILFISFRDESNVVFSFEIFKNLNWSFGLWIWLSIGSSIVERSWSCLFLYKNLKHL